MSIHQIKCSNCGALIKVDSELETPCLFCHAPNTLEQGKALENQPDYVYPHNSYPAPSQEIQKSLAALYRGKAGLVVSKKKTTSAQPAPKKHTKPSLSPRERVERFNTPIITPVANKKVLYPVVLAFLFLLVSTIGLNYYYNTKTNHLRANIIQHFVSKGHSFADNTLVYDFQNLASTKLRLVLAEELTEEKAHKLWEDFLSSLQESQVIDNAHTSSTSIELTLLDPSKRLILSQEQGSSELKVQTEVFSKEDVAKLQKLKTEEKN